MMQYDSNTGQVPFKYQIQANRNKILTESQKNLMVVVNQESNKMHRNKIDNKKYEQTLNI